MRPGSELDDGFADDNEGGAVSCEAAGRKSHDVVRGQVRTGSHRHEMVGLCGSSVRQRRAQNTQNTQNNQAAAAHPRLPQIRLPRYTRDAGQKCCSPGTSEHLLVPSNGTSGTLTLMTDATLPIGRRVLVTGMAGSGKSAFSRLLAAKTGLPIIHLDLHFWKPGWVAPSEGEWRKSNGAARRRRVDRRWQLPRDTRPPPRTRGHHRGSQHALVGVRGTCARARRSKAGWRDARRVPRFGLATVAR